MRHKPITCPFGNDEVTDSHACNICSRSNSHVSVLRCKGLLHASKLQYSTFSPTTRSLTWILQFLSPFLLSQKCSSFSVRLPLCKQLIKQIKQYSQSGLSDFHPFHNKKSHLYSPLCCLRLISYLLLLCHTLVTWT